VNKRQYINSNNNSPKRRICYYLTVESGIITYASLNVEKNSAEWALLFQTKSFCKVHHRKSKHTFMLLTNKKRSWHNRKLFSTNFHNHEKDDESKIPQRGKFL